MSRLSISSWSLHRALGPMYRPADDNSGDLVPHKETAGELSLLELPARVAQLGIKTLEICHFHFPTLDEDYISDLRSALKEADVELFSILVDAGDITHPDSAKREKDLQWIREWLEVTAKCGATHARVIAGDADITVDNGNVHEHSVIRLSAKNLRELARFGREHGVQVITENFRPLTKRAEHLLAILDLCEGEVGLCADFGNYRGQTKYDELAAIFPRADSAHAKAHYEQPGEMERDDFIRCMDMTQESGFDGPYSLIFDGPGSEWDSLAEIQQIVESYVND